MSFHDLQDRRCFHWHHAGPQFRATEDVDEEHKTFRTVMAMVGIAVVLLVAALIFNGPPTALEALALVGAVPLAAWIVYGCWKKTKEPNANRRPWVYEIDFATETILVGMLATDSPQRAIDKRDERSLSQLRAVTLDYKKDSDQTNELKLTLLFEAGDQVTLFSFESGNAKLVMSDLIRQFRRLAAGSELTAMPTGLQIKTIGITVG